MRPHRLLILLILLIAGLAIAYYLKTGNQPENKKLVVAVFPVTVDAFEQFQAEARGVFERNNTTFNVLSAEGDAEKFQTVIDAALLQQPDVLVLVGTQLTNIGLGPKYSNYNVKIISTCISDVSQVDALVRIGIEPPRKRPVAILSDMPKHDSYELSANIISTTLPFIQKVGIFYNKSEINSYNTASSLAAALEKKGLSIIHGVISGEDDVTRVVADAIRRGAQLLVIPHDKYVIKKAGAIRKMAMDTKPSIPVFALDDGTVKKDGAAFGVSVNYGYLGKLTADRGMQILKGERPEYMEVIRQEYANLIVNKKTWETLKLPPLSSGIFDTIRPILVE